MIYNVLILDQNDRDEAVEAAGLPKFREGVHRTSAWVDSSGEKPLILTNLRATPRVNCGVLEKVGIVVQTWAILAYFRGAQRKGADVFSLPPETNNSPLVPKCIPAPLQNEESYNGGPKPPSKNI